MKIISFRDSNGNGTCLQGYIKTTYYELVSIFGEPKYGPNNGGDKTTCEWAIDIFYADPRAYGGQRKETVTIYDWHQYNTPFNEYRWHIGGSNFNAVALVYAAMNMEMETENV
jgi:hypothetical protein